MTFWIWTWTICLVAAVAAFAVMAVLVSIGGAFDIRRLFRRLRESKADDQGSSDEWVAASKPARGAGERH